MAKYTIEEIREYIKYFRKVVKQCKTITDNFCFMYFIIQFGQYLVCKYSSQIGKVNSDDKKSRVTGPREVKKNTKSDLLKNIARLRNSLCHISDKSLYRIYSHLLNDINDPNPDKLYDEVVDHGLTILREYLSSEENRKAFKEYLDDMFAVSDEEEDNDNTKDIHDKNILNMQVSEF